MKTRTSITHPLHVYMVKAGTLDDFSGITPAIEVYTDHAAAWVAPIAGAKRFGQSAG